MRAHGAEERDRIGPSQLRGVPAEQRVEGGGVQLDLRAERLVEHPRGSVDAAARRLATPHVCLDHAGVRDGVGLDPGRAHAAQDVPCLGRLPPPRAEIEHHVPRVDGRGEARLLQSPEIAQHALPVGRLGAHAHERVEGIRVGWHAFRPHALQHRLGLGALPSHAVRLDERVVHGGFRLHDRCRAARTHHHSLGRR
eukprot:scaffold4944_cov135-Isochrysis_galbana.AAC.3